jgi:putative membrane protein
MKNIKREIKKNTFVLLVSKPSIYLKELVWRTLLIGGVTLGIITLIHYLEFDSFSVPSSMHSLIGIVIGLLLVFRTNTAYDRWWEGRKMISGLSHEIGLISARLNSMKSPKNHHSVEEFRLIVDGFLKNLRDYLKIGDDGNESVIFHLSQKRKMERAFNSLKNMGSSDTNINALNASIGKLLEYSNALERIKNTPIPLSYKLHIKMSIFIYLMTLPFGLFHDLGMWAVPLVMLIYYIIAGVEIISNEIENPFAEDPNDLPTAELFNGIIDSLHDKE